MLYTTVVLALGWDTCNFPAVSWLVADQGTGKSATQKVAGLGNNAYVAGYSTGNTTIMSSVAGTLVRRAARAAPRARARSRISCTSACARSR